MPSVPETGGEMNELYQCEPMNSTMRYSVIAKDETEAIRKVRQCCGIPDDVAIAVKRKEYLGWVIWRWQAALGWPLGER